MSKSLFPERRLLRRFSMMRNVPAPCAQVSLHLTDFLEGDLPEQEHRQIESHLAECSACHKVLKDLRLTISLLSKLPKPTSRNPRARPPGNTETDG